MSQLHEIRVKSGIASDTFETCVMFVFAWLRWTDLNRLFTLIIYRVLYLFFLRSSNALPSKQPSPPAQTSVSPASVVSDKVSVTSSYTTERHSPEEAAAPRHSKTASAATTSTEPLSIDEYVRIYCILFEIVRTCFSGVSVVSFCLLVDNLANMSS